MIEAPPRAYVPAGKKPLRRYASQLAVQQPTKSPKFPAPGGTCAHFDRVVMLMSFCPTGVSIARPPGPVPPDLTTALASPAARRTCNECLGNSRQANYDSFENFHIFGTYTHLALLTS
jgi:hypothetical protein